MNEKDMDFWVNDGKIEETITLYSAEGGFWSSLCNARQVLALALEVKRLREEKK